MKDFTMSDTIFSEVNDWFSLIAAQAKFAFIAFGGNQEKILAATVGIGTKIKDGQLHLKPLWHHAVTEIKDEVPALLKFKELLAGCSTEQEYNLRLSEVILKLADRVDLSGKNDSELMDILGIYVALARWENLNNKESNNINSRQNFKKKKAIGKALAILDLMTSSPNMIGYYNALADANPIDAGHRDKIAQFIFEDTTDNDVVGRFISAAGIAEPGGLIAEKVCFAILSELSSMPETNPVEALLKVIGCMAVIASGSYSQKRFASLLLVE